MMGFTARTLYHAPKFKSETNQYPALMAVMVSSPRFVYPSAVKKLGYAGAHSGLARSEPFGDILFSGA